MKRIGVAIISLIALVLLAPSIKTLFETLIGEAEDIVGGYPVFVNFIFSNLPLFFILGIIGFVIWSLFRRRTGQH